MKLKMGWFHSSLVAVATEPWDKVLLTGNVHITFWEIRLRTELLNRITLSIFITHL